MPRSRDCDDKGWGEGGGGGRRGDAGDKNSSRHWKSALGEMVQILRGGSNSSRWFKFSTLLTRMRCEIEDAGDWFVPCVTGNRHTD